MSVALSIEERAALKGRRAVVLGAAQGLGEGICRALADSGVDLVICDVAAEELAVTAQALRERGRTVHAHTVDVCDVAALDAFWSAVDAAFDSIDIVVNVVGGVKDTPFLQTTPAQWEADTRRNFGYVVQSCHHAARRMAATGRGGSIVNITTIEGYRAAPGFSVYAGLKSGVANLSRSLATELAPQRIRVNCVAPDQTPTPGLFACIDLPTYDPPPPGLDGPAVMALAEQQAVNAIPLGRMGTTDDIGNAVLFLAGDLSAYLTGQTLHVDGGAFASAGWLNFPQLGFRNRVPLKLIAQPEYLG